MLKKTNYLKTLKQSVCSAALAGFLIFSPSAHGTTLEQAIEIAIEHNPRIGVVARNQEAVVEELHQAEGLYLPSVDISAGVGVEDTSTPAVRAGNNGESEGLLATDATLTITQDLFDGYERQGRVERQKARIESASNRVYENSENLALDVVGAYLDVIRQRELLALARENVAFHVETLEALVKRLRGGIGTRADVIQTQARLARSRATFVSTNNDLADAEALYTRLVGQYPGDLVLPSTVEDMMPASMDELVQMATIDNPTVKISEADVKVANADVNISEAEFYPQVSLQASSTYDERKDGVNTYTYQNILGLRMNWNIFNGGTDRATRQEFLMREEQSKSQRYDAILEAQQQARRSWYAYVAAGQQLQELSSAVIFNQQTREAYEQQFQVDQRTLLDVLDAENELFTSRGQLISADINKILSSYRILAVAGKLLRSLNVSAPQQAFEAVLYSQDD